MRDFKFRAWDKQYKQMVTVTMILFDSEEIDYKGNNGEPKSIEHFILMQYTGLKDKHGKEIYEGDIIQLVNSNFKYKVVFEDGCFCCYHLVALNGAKWGLLYRFEELKDRDFEIEIIGNFYETV
jgi:uncharacterized phage protein (TIGR01671 family)